MNPPLSELIATRTHWYLQLRAKIKALSHRNKHAIWANGECYRLHHDADRGYVHLQLSDVKRSFTETLMIYAGFTDEERQLFTEVFDLYQEYDKTRRAIAEALL